MSLLIRRVNRFEPVCFPHSNRFYAISRIFDIRFAMQSHMRIISDRSPSHNNKTVALFIFHIIITISKDIINPIPCFILSASSWFINRNILQSVCMYSPPEYSTATAAKAGNTMRKYYSRKRDGLAETVELHQIFTHTTIFLGRSQTTPSIDHIIPNTP